MYYILDEGLKIESNEPVYCTVDRFVLHFFRNFKNLHICDNYVCYDE